MVFMLSQPAVENLQQVLIACINHRNCRGKAPLISVQDSWWRILQLYRSETLQYNSQSLREGSGVLATHYINIQLCPARNKSTGGKQGGSSADNKYRWEISWPVRPERQGSWCLISTNDFVFPWLSRFNYLSLISKYNLSWRIINHRERNSPVSESLDPL